MFTQTIMHIPWYHKMVLPVPKNRTLAAEVAPPSPRKMNITNDYLRSSHPSLTANPCFNGGFKDADRHVMEATTKAGQELWRSFCCFGPYGTMRMGTGYRRQADRLCRGRRAIAAAHLPI